MQTGPTIQNSSSSTGAVCIWQEKTPLLNPKRKRRVQQDLASAGEGSADFSAPFARRSRRRRTLVLAPGPGRAAYWRVDHGYFGRRLRGSGLRRRILGAQATDPRGLQPTPDVATFWDAVGAAADAATRQQNTAKRLVASRNRGCGATWPRDGSRGEYTVLYTYRLGHVCFNNSL
jgi:hypothetical protein